MLKLLESSQEQLNTKDRVTIDLIKDGQVFLEQFEINRETTLDTVLLIYKFLRVSGKIPHNLFKFFVAGYYIISRNPRAFPVHESKKKFCKKFELQPSSLDYCVERISSALKLVKILDDENYPYFIDPKSDFYLNVVKRIVKKRVEKEMMDFLLFDKPVNSQVLSESLVSEIVLEEKIFPEDLFRQFYEIILELIENELQDYNEYAALQQKYFI